MPSSPSPGSPPTPKPPPSELLNVGVDCWRSCSFQPGECPNFCGDGGACCSVDDADIQACGFGESGCTGFHCCSPLVVRSPPLPPPLPPIPPSPPSPSPSELPTLGFPVFSTPFRVSSSGGHLWIEPEADSSLRERLHIKGANWAGFQQGGCPHILWEYDGRRTLVQDYVEFLTRHSFNAVRLPLSSVLVNANGPVASNCGEAYSGQSTLSVLDDVLTRLRDAVS